MKKPAAVVAAEEALHDKAKELASAQGVVQQLEREHAEAVTAVRKAHEEADSALPQCRLVRVRWRSGKEEDMWRVVILRKTPSGILVVRRVGEPSGGDFKFKWRGYSAQFTQAEKKTMTYGDHMELRDVPAEYIPT